jgi:hypothetical protein
MFIRNAFIVSLLGVFGYASIAFANSCGNVDVFGTFDRSGLQEGDFGIYAVGTFRIEGEGDEDKQPDFNLATVNCEKKSDEMGRVTLECKVTMAAVRGTSDKPDTDKQRGGPGCLNRFSASISGASARVRLPSGVAAG